MLAEAGEAPQAVARLLASDRETYAALAADLRNAPPAAMLTVARGSSDHAAHYMAYLTMARLGRLVTSLPMSLVTLYPSRLVCDGLVAFGFSQSGQSPDIVAPIAAVRERGARTVALVNDTASPLAKAAQWLLPLHAGREQSVAATKSYIAQLVAGARLVALWEREKTLLDAVEALPEALSKAAALDWSPAVEALRDVDRLYVIGRGTGHAVTMEAALKLKETSAIHAEAFSSAEVLHGPAGIIGPGFPVLAFAPADAAREGFFDALERLASFGAAPLLIDCQAHPRWRTIVALDGGHPLLTPIVALHAFYRVAEATARWRGRDPDQPPHLRKVTETL